MKNQKRILLIMPYGSVGGMERLALTFYNYYKSQGHTVMAVKFIKLNSDIVNFGDDELYLSSKDFHAMTTSQRYIFYLSGPKTLRVLIKRYRITHSIAFGDMANLFSSLTFTKEFKVGSIHALKSVELSSNTLFTKLTNLGYRSCYRKLDKLICISKSIKEDLITNCNYRFSNLEVIYNPHAVDDIRLFGKESLESSEEELFKNQVIIFVGRLSIQKAPWHIINAFKLLVSNNKRIKLLFVGDGDSQVTSFIQRMILEYNLEKDVFLLGRKSNPYKYIARASVLALSSFYEGTPNVIVESIALGVPIVSSNCTQGISEMMSLRDEELNSKQNTVVEAGIITPTFYKGYLKIPDSIGGALTTEEICFSNALKAIISSSVYKENLDNTQEKLLAKFELQEVCNSYLK